MYLLGTDEAGYGPNLGPLVIAASVWSLPDDVDLTQLDKQLQKGIARKLPARPKANSRRKPDDRFVVVDSKQLYQSAQGIEALERHVHTALHLAGVPLSSWRSIWNTLTASAECCLDKTPWHDDYDESLPIEAEPTCAERLKKLSLALSTHGVQLTALKVRVVFPGEFNDLVNRWGTKSHVLSHLTLELLCRLLHELPDGRASAICDKHGGRNHYGEFLQPHVPDWIEVVRESAAESLYRWGAPTRRVELRLQPRSEAHLPTALASMAAKYVRELAMRAFNRFWCDRIPGLKPTAGYPGDARRFKSEIEALQIKLGIDDAILWRQK